MDIDQLHTRLHDIGIEVPIATLKRWGYDKREIIPRPKRYKHGTGSGKSGRAANWSDEAFLQAAAVWAVLNTPRTTGHPSLSHIPIIKRDATQPYKSPFAGYRLSGLLSADPQSKKELSYKLITVHFGFDTSLGEEPVDWQVLLTTWIAAIEKARRGIRIDTPQQVRFHWKSVKVENGVDYEPEKVNDFDDDVHVSVHESESGLDEIIIMIDGVDFRKTTARALGFATNPS
jgi:hypothetical protein